VKTILILEDNKERIVAFQKPVALLGSAGREAIPSDWLVARECFLCDAAMRKELAKLPSEKGGASGVRREEVRRLDVGGEVPD